MCMTYKGVDYHYAFEFVFPVCYNPVGETFRVVVTDFLDEIKGYSGLCLENELFVISENKNIEFEAFIDIIDEIVNITTSSITSYAKANGGCIPTPHRKVDDGDFIKKFNEAKNSFISRRYKELLDRHYNELQKYLFDPSLITQNTYKEMEPDIRILLIILFIRLYIYQRLPLLKGIEIFKL